MSEWYYARGGQQSGPITFDHLKSLAQSGQLSPNDLIWTSTLPDWQRADLASGLFESSSPADVPPADPNNPYAAPQSAWDEVTPASGSALGEIVPGSDPIDVGACVKRGFELTKRHFGTIFLVGLTYFGVSIGASMIIGMIVPAVGAGANQASSESLTAVAVVSQILLQVLSIYLSLGLVRIGLNLVSGKEVSVGQLFGEGSKLLPAIGASIILGFMVVIGFILLIVPGFYLLLRYGQFMNGMVDRNLGVIDSLKYSSSITTNNRLNLFLLMILAIGIVIAGALALLVGLIFAYPVVWLSWVVAYRWMQYGGRAVEDHPGTTTPLLSSV